MSRRLGDWSDPAYRVVGDPDRVGGPYIFTCEHASNAVPWSDLSPSDAALLDMHWGWDIGAAQAVESLCRRTDSVGVLSTLSRLVIDVNRSPQSETLVVSRCADTPVTFNQSISSSELEHRTRTIHEGYHLGIEDVFSRRLRRGPAHLISVHSFTPVWDGTPRTMEVGVLFDRYPDEAHQVAEALSATGLAVELNAPYSGMSGELMYAATRHGAHFDRPYLEFEIRQDLLQSEDNIEAITEALTQSLSVFRP